MRTDRNAYRQHGEQVVCPGVAVRRPKYTPPVIRVYGARARYWIALLFTLSATIPTIPV